MVLGEVMSRPLFVPNTERRVQEEVIYYYGFELSYWVLGLIMEELDWVRPMIEVETLRRAIENQIGKPKGGYEGVADELDYQTGP